MAALRIRAVCLARSPIQLTCLLTVNPAPFPKPAKGLADLPPGRRDKGRNETSSALISYVAGPITVLPVPTECYLHSKLHAWKTSRRWRVLFKQLPVGFFVVAKHLAQQLLEVWRGTYRVRGLLLPGRNSMSEQCWNCEATYRTAAFLTCFAVEFWVDEGLAASRSFR